jgi:hypothetical protein
MACVFAFRFTGIMTNLAERLLDGLLLVVVAG